MLNSKTADQVKRPEVQTIMSETSFLPQNQVLSSSSSSSKKEIAEKDAKRVIINVITNNQFVRLFTIHKLLNSMRAEQMKNKKIQTLNLPSFLGRDRRRSVLSTSLKLRWPRIASISALITLPAVEPAPTDSSTKKDPKRHSTDAALYLV